MKKVLLILTTILTSVSAVWADGYAINFDKTVKYYDYRKEYFRWIEQIGLRIEGYSDQILSTGFQDCYNSTNYTDLTSDTKLAARIGQTVTPLWKQNTNAMFGWVYIDLNNDGDFEDENERIGTSGEWKGVTTSTLSTSNSFVIPNTTPGDYHIRFNVAWTDNPKGYSSILSDGGSITDAIITIVASEYTVAANEKINISNITNYNFYESFNVPASSTLVVDVDNFDLTKIKGDGTISFDDARSTTSSVSSNFTGVIKVNHADAVVTIQGDLGACTLQKNNGTLNYAGKTLNGTTLEGVILTGNNRITTSNTVTIKNLAGNNLNNQSGEYNYAFIGNDNSTIIFIGTCNLTLKSDGSTTNANAKVGYNSTSNIVIEENANLKAVALFNSNASNNNAAIWVKNGATVTCTGTSDYLWSSSLKGSGNIILSAFPTASTHPTISNDWTGSIEFAAGGSSNTDLTSLFNAWGNENSTIKLNDVSGGYLLTYDSNNQNTIVNPTLNILTGKTLTLNNGNSGANARLSKVTGAGTIDRQGWNKSNNHNLYITRLTNFTGTLKGTGHPIIVEYLIRNLGPTVDEQLFKTSGTVYFSKSAPYNSKLYIGNMDVTAAYAWEEKNVSSVNGYYITESVPTKINEALVLANKYIGTGVGKYTFSLKNETYNNYSDFAYVVASTMQTLQDWENYPITSIINQPTTGYYRLKSKFNENTGYYLSCENNNDGKAIQTTTTDAKNIFYIEVGNSNSSINSYSTGFYFGNETYSNYTSATNDPIKWTFSEGANKGTYTLTSTYSGSKILFGWSGDESKSYVDRNGVATDDGHTDWILISVAQEELPVIPAPGVSDASRPVLLGNITSASDVTNNITASAKFVDLSQATIGTSIDDIKAAVNDINPNAIIIAPEGTSVGESTSNVLVKTNTAGTYKCENLQLNDDVIAQFTTKTNFTADTKVTYTRAATGSGWGTIYLPYKPEVEEGVSYYELTSSSESSLTFTRVDNPSANTPYMYKKESEGVMSVTNEITEVGFSLVGDYNKYEGELDDNGYQLVGILTNSSIVESEGTEAKAGYNQIVDPNAYYFKNTDRKFYSLNQRFNMKAFRCYLTTTNNSARQNVLGISYEENDEPTGVSFIESEDGNTVDVIFDLNGRRLQNAKKGINIINGKKVIK